MIFNYERTFQFLEKKLIKNHTTIVTFEILQVSVASWIQEKLKNTELQFRLQIINR